MLVDGKIFVDKDIFLKPLEIADLEIVYNLTKKNKKELVKWFDWAEERLTIKSSLNFIQRSIRENKNNNRCDLGIFYKGKLAGIFGLINLDRNDNSIELAYWLSSDFQKKGIVIRTCKKMEEYCFDVLDLNEVLIIAFAENTGSRAIPEKLGFESIDADKKPTRMHKKKSYYIYYSKMHTDYKNNFWNYLNNIYTNSKVIIDCKSGEINSVLNDKISPVDFGHLENDWEKDEQMDVWIGTDDKQNFEINAIVCVIDIKQKFCDISLLLNCTENEKKQVFNCLKEIEGVLLVEK